MTNHGDTASGNESNAVVFIDAKNTLVAKTSDHNRWFDQSTGMPIVRSNNEVFGLIDGDESLRFMATTINSAINDQHYIYLLNWFLDTDFILPGTAPPSNLENLLSTAVGRNVQVRAMLWDQWGGQNRRAVSRINSLSNGAAIHDNNTLNFGSHHQKILVVNGWQGLISFCGGVDFNPDRTQITADQPGSPMHDVHCCITGPAAWDLLQIFIQRWEDHPDSPALDRAKGPLRGRGEPLPPNKGNHFVQIGRTYGNGVRHPGIRNKFNITHYTFAPIGEETAWKIIRHAIQQARQYIYMEEQYLVSMAASDVLRDKLPDIQYLIILIPHSEISTLPQVWRRRRDFIDNLLSKGNSQKVAICFRQRANQPLNSPHNYVHSKIFIIDDEFSIIGSANCNRRGYTHDSEVVAGIFDPDFARELRKRLWAEHLNLSPGAVNDPLASAPLWFNPPPGSFIGLYDPRAGSDSTINPFSRRFWTWRNGALLTNWDTEVDPDGHAGRR